MADLREEKMAGNQKIIKANKDSSVEIPEVEKGLIHVKLQPRGRDEDSGNLLHKAILQCFVPADFKKMDDAGAFKQYLKVTIVHDPRTETQVKNDEETASPNSTANTAPEKPLDRMNKTEIQAKYFQLYQEAAPEEWTIKDIRGKIDEKLLFLDAEKQLNGPGGLQ